MPTRRRRYFYGMLLFVSSLLISPFSGAQEENQSQDKCTTILQEVKIAIANLSENYKDEEIDLIILRLKECEAYIDGKLETYSVFAYLGLSYLLKNDENMALSYFNKELDINPKDEMSYFFKGSIYTEKAEKVLFNLQLSKKFDEQKIKEVEKQIIEYTDKALENFQRLLNKDYKGPIIQGMLSCDTSEILVLMARCYKIRGEDDKAKELLNKVVNKYPNGVGYEEAKSEIDNYSK